MFSLNFLFQYFTFIFCINNIGCRRFYVWIASFQYPFRWFVVREVQGMSVCLMKGESYAESCDEWAVLLWLSYMLTVAGRVAADAMHGSARLRVFTANGIALAIICTGLAIAVLYCIHRFNTNNYTTPGVIITGTLRLLWYNILNKSIQTGDFYTQTLVTYNTSGDAKLTSTPLRWQAEQTAQKSTLSQLKTASKINNKRWYRRWSHSLKQIA